jgi:hypothetical protein
MKYIPVYSCPIHSVISNQDILKTVKKYIDKEEEWNPMKKEVVKKPFVGDIQKNEFWVVKRKKINNPETKYYMTG